jgi:hypothetical protein
VAPTGHGYALLFVSGRYQGTVFALPSDGALVLGRDSDVELVLSEDLVSRRHAELAVKEGEVMLRDLGSTNGTFVNGQRVKKVKLAVGDRVLVGSSLMKLVPAAAGTHSTPPVLVTKTRAQAALQGKLEEVPLPDLVQLIASSRKSGVLLLKRDEEECRIDLREGKLAACSLSAAPAVADKKAFWRVLAWERGSFELIPPAVPPPLAAIQEDVAGGLRAHPAAGGEGRGGAAARREASRSLPGGAGRPPGGDAGRHHPGDPRLRPGA